MSKNSNFDYISDQNKPIEQFVKALNTVSDINEHLLTLYNYSRESTSIIECGVRSIVSTWAFLQGLIDNDKKEKILISLDIEECPGINNVELISKNHGINFAFIKKNDINYIPDNSVDLLFIDTWHIYGQLKRELDHYYNYVNKYIIMHDTTIDGINGESLRYNCDIHKQSIESGFSEEEIKKGLRPAIDEFLENHKNWILHKNFTNCNGLTVLKKI